MIKDIILQELSRYENLCIYNLAPPVDLATVKLLPLNIKPTQPGFIQQDIRPSNIFFNISNSKTIHSSSFDTIMANVPPCPS